MSPETTQEAEGHSLPGMVYSGPIDRRRAPFSMDSLLGGYGEEGLTVLEKDGVVRLNDVGLVYQEARRPPSTAAATTGRRSCAMAPWTWHWVGRCAIRARRARWLTLAIFGNRLVPFRPLSALLASAGVAPHGRRRGLARPKGGAEPRCRKCAIFGSASAQSQKQSSISFVFYWLYGFA